jgi:glycerol-3-phosphate dehydrogenase (NAD(P)+)
VAEGVNTAIEVNKRSDVLKVDMPITREVFNVIHNGKSAKDAVLDLLGRSLKQEH